MPPSPLHPHPVADLAPRPSRRLPFLASLVVYLGLGWLVWKAPSLFPQMPPAVPTLPKSVALLLIDEQAPPHAVLPPIPPPEGGGGDGGEAALALMADPPSEVSAPLHSADDVDEIPASLPTQAAPISSFSGVAGIGHGRSAGSGGGSGGGVGSGIGSGMGPGKQAVVLSIEDLDIESYEKPEYPRLAEQGGIEGIVRVRLLVDESGVPLKVWAVEGSPLFIPSTIKSLQRWRFGALKTKKIPAPAEVEFLVRFILDRPSRK